jgi:spore germination protein GerM
MATTDSAKLFASSQTINPDFTGAAQERNKRVHLYFAHREGRYLSSEQRLVSGELWYNPLQMGRFIIEALIKGPKADADLMPVIAKGTILRAFFLESNGTATVDLTLPSREQQTGGAMAELLTIYAVVNSLTLNIEGVERVKLLVDGREAVTLAGHVEIGDYFRANMLIIR